MVSRLGQTRGAGEVRSAPAAAPEDLIRVRNAVQARLALSSQSVDGEGEQKLLAWITRNAATFAALWDGDEALRGAVMERWDSNPGWCVAEVRRRARGAGL